jgi:hypothetical protein
VTSAELQYAFGKRVGNRLTFAAEFEAYKLPVDVTRLWNEWWGCLWLWADGRLVGNPTEFELVMTGLDSLEGAAAEERTAASRILSACTPREALRAVMWAKYGEDCDPAVSVGAVDKEMLQSLEVLPERTGSFFDGWEAILLDDAAEEHFIYRKNETAVAEAVWPTGTFRRVIVETRAEFEKLARKSLGASIN